VTPELVHRLEKKYSQSVSELVVMRWKMPVAIINAIKPYQDLDKNDQAFGVAAAVHSAARFATYILDVGAEDDEETLMELDALDALDLNEDQVQQLLTLQDSVQHRVEQLSS
jgi:HD-like signal output (HDOD) protein